MSTDLNIGRQADCGARDFTDEEFLVAFEGLALASDRFRHYDHLRLAWIMLRASDDDIDVATARMVGALRTFALHHAGSLAKYHDTVTRSYMHLVEAHRRRTPAIGDFQTFALAHPELFDRKLLFEYFSESVIASAAARTQWIDPDRRALPHSGGVG
ncbi:MAG: hypothetical protein ABJE10_20930 [bacterium]